MARPDLAKLMGQDQLEHWLNLGTHEALNQIPPGLLAQVIQQESRWNPQARSPVGALGLMQVMPATARQPGFGVKPLSNPFDPEENVRFGAQYLGAMLKRYGGDKEAALIAYNAGPGPADKWIKSRNDELLADETKGYKKNILAGFANAIAPAAVAAVAPQPTAPEQDVGDELEQIRMAAFGDLISGKQPPATPVQAPAEQPPALDPADDEIRSLAFADLATKKDYSREQSSFLENLGAGAATALEGYPLAAKQVFGKAEPAEIEDFAARQEALRRTGGGILGEIGAEAATWLVPSLKAVKVAGALTKTAPKAAKVGAQIGASGAVGAGVGATRPVEEGETRAGNAGEGLIGGVLGDVALRGAGRAFFPYRGLPKQAYQTMVDKAKGLGIKLDVGQENPVFRSFNNFLSSVSINGKKINADQKEKITKLTQRVLTESGGSLSEGEAAVIAADAFKKGADSLKSRYGAEYEKLFKDNQFIMDDELIQAAKASLEEYNLNFKGAAKDGQSIATTVRSIAGGETPNPMLEGVRPAMRAQMIQKGVPEAVGVPPMYQSGQEVPGQVIQNARSAFTAAAGEPGAEGVLARQGRSAMEGFIERSVPNRAPDLDRNYAMARELADTAEKANLNKQGLLDKLFKGNIETTEKFRKVAGKPAEDAVRRAYLTELLESSKDKKGNIDATKVLSRIDSLPDTARWLLPQAQRTNLLRDLGMIQRDVLKHPSGQFGDWVRNQNVVGLGLAAGTGGMLGGGVIPAAAAVAVPSTLYQAINRVPGKAIANQLTSPVFRSTVDPLTALLLSNQK